MFQLVNGLPLLLVEYRCLHCFFADFDPQLDFPLFSSPLRWERSWFSPLWIFFLSGIFLVHSNYCHFRVSASLPKALVNLVSNPFFFRCLLRTSMMKYSRRYYVQFFSLIILFLLIIMQNTGLFIDIENLLCKFLFDVVRVKTSHINNHDSHLVIDIACGWPILANQKQEHRQNRVTTSLAFLLENNSNFIIFN